MITVRGVATVIGVWPAEGAAQSLIGRGLASVRLLFEKSASDIRAPARTLPERLAPTYLHWRRSRILSDTALAWPMVLPS